MTAALMNFERIRATMLLCFRTRVFTLTVLAVVLLGCNSLRPVRQAQVTIDLYSGRADNPTWMLSPADTQTLLGKVSALAPVDYTELSPGNLGYRGFVVELESPGERVRAYQGVVAWQRGEVVVYADPERTIELWLLGTGRQQLEPSLYQTIRSAVMQP